MPRNCRQRRIIAPPRFRGYKPYGCVLHDNEPIELLYEEYEAIKLADYKQMNHQEAAVLMGVSRATFARIYEKARRKIAQALVETKEITTSAGHSYSDNQWYTCNDCHARFTLPYTEKGRKCPLCKSKQIETSINRNTNENTNYIIGK